MVGLQTLDLAIGVRVPASQKSCRPDSPSGLHHFYQRLNTVFIFFIKERLRLTTILSAGNVSGNVFKK
jgi:hypothetical protein